MMNIAMNDCVYKVHPIYDLYSSDKDGNVMNIVKTIPVKGNEQRNGYIQCVVRKYGGKQKHIMSIDLFGNVLTVTYQTEK